MDLNIDEILGSSRLKVIVGSKEYFVTDVPIEDFLKPADESKGIDALRQQVAKILNTTIDDIRPLGIRSLMLIITNVRSWLMGDDLIKQNADVGKKEVAGNP